MIPETIHYCWFGRNPKPKLALKCIKSWKKHCPDYEIIEWNEDNFDISSCPLYVRQAYEAKKWAFVTDYVRLKVVYEHGGIYLDTDVELLKGLDTLLKYNAYFGFEDGFYVNTGLGFGAVKGSQILLDMMRDYETIPFVKEDGKLDITPCPQRNTEALKRYGLVQNDTRQVLDRRILILPTVVLCPLSFSTGKLRKTKDTISIHRFSATWKSKEDKRREKERKKALKRDYIIHIPNRVGMKLLGDVRYIKLKSFFGR